MPRFFKLRGISRQQIFRGIYRKSREIRSTAREFTENLQKNRKLAVVYKMYGHFPVNSRFPVLFLSQLGPTHYGVRKITVIFYSVVIKICTLHCNSLYSRKNYSSLGKKKKRGRLERVKPPVTSGVVINPCSPEGFSSQTYFPKGGCCNPPWIIKTEGHITLNLLPVYRYGHPLSTDTKISTNH